MTTRRDFLASTAGIAFVGCSMLSARPTAA